MDFRLRMNRRPNLQVASLQAVYTVAVAVQLLQMVQRLMAVSLQVLTLALEISRMSISSLQPPVRVCMEIRRCTIVLCRLQ